MVRKGFAIGCLILLGCLLWSADKPGTAPLIVGGKFSSSGSHQNTTVFDAQARDAEITALNQQLKDKDFTGAIKRINELVANHFMDKRFYLQLAIAYGGLNRWHDVIYAAGQAIAVAPQDPRAYVLRAQAYLHEGDYDRCSIDVDKALSLNPNSKMALSVKKELEQKIQDAGKRGGMGEMEKPTPTWLILYIVVVLLAVAIFVYLRYEDFFRGGGKTSYNRKEIEVKEQYDFIRQIGEGGMGKVYEAYDKVLKRKVAIKRVRPELVRSTYVREQFLAEARLVALLRHPCIVEIYTVIESESSLYLVFEYVDGQTLETRLDIDGHISFAEAKRIFDYVCRGLNYAHSQDIIHCDLKPGNIMIREDGSAKVMDFGVAKKSVDGQTGARTVAGTPAYMAPEQQKGFMRKQSDVYSLALCLYEALVGQVPWSVKGFDIAHKKIYPTSKLVHGIPVEVDRLLEDALKEDPKERIQSIEEFWTRLKAIEPLSEEKTESPHIPE